MHFRTGVQVFNTSVCNVVCSGSFLSLNKRQRCTLHNYKHYYYYYKRVEELKSENEQENKWNRNKNKIRCRKEPVDINRLCRNIHVQQSTTVSINTQMHRGGWKYVDLNNRSSAGVQKSDGSWIDACSHAVSLHMHLQAAVCTCMWRGWMRHQQYSMLKYKCLTIGVQ